VRRSSGRARGARGFTLVESLVTLAIVLMTMVGLLTMLDSATRIARAESHTADAQNSSRSGISYVTRLLREARVGQLSYGNAVLPFADNAAAGTTITDMQGGVHTLRTGTDAVQVRGVFTGETSVFGPGDVTCAGGPCTLSSTAISVTIRQRTTSGYVNYAAGSRPALASMNAPFAFVVASGAPQTLAVGARSYVAPFYVVGRVDTSGSWYTETATSFTFVMNATDTRARLLAATNDSAAVVPTATTGGVVEDVVFFVDRGDAEAHAPSQYLHPFLAQGTRDLATGLWDVAPIAPEVEDFQVAYGIDGAGGSARDGGVDPSVVAATTDGDEWIGSAAGESLTITQSPPRVEAFYDSSVPSVPPYPTRAAPALRSLLVSIITKSAAPDPGFAGPGAFGIRSLNSTALSVSAADGRAYRRRAQTMAVSLRNFT
jgi:prepilin-type N-terminal cleavage/methylation domain-containing protein